jgi:hypothetical protein
LRLIISEGEKSRIPLGIDGLIVATVLYLNSKSAKLSFQIYWEVKVESLKLKVEKWKVRKLNVESLKV